MTPVKCAVLFVRKFYGASKFQMIYLYNILSVMAIMFGLPVIVPVVLLFEKRRKTVLQRLGLINPWPGRERGRHGCSGKKPLWIHALSVGEVLSAVPLVKKLNGYLNDTDVVVSVSTKTGYNIAVESLKDEGNAIFYFPYDLLFSVKHVRKKINPAMVIIVETDIWPNFMHEMKIHNIPMIMANARISERSYDGYRRFGIFVRSAFSSFAYVLAQSRVDFDRLIKLGVLPERVSISGNIKFDTDIEYLSFEDIKEIGAMIHVRHFQKVFIAGSTHKGEESILLDVFLKLKAMFKNLLLIVAPRDPKRGDAISHMFRSAGFTTGLLNEIKNKPSTMGHDVVVVDTMGVLKKLYAVADIAFIGGSLVASGGHNPLEPAMFSKPVLFGPDMSDFSETARMLLKSKGAVMVEDKDSLFETVTMLLENEEKARSMGGNAMNVLKANRGAIDKTLDVIQSFL